MTANRHYRPWPDTQPTPAEPCTHYGMDDKPELRIVAGLVAWVVCILLGLALLAVVLIAAVRL